MESGQSTPSSFLEWSRSGGSRSPNNIQNATFAFNSGAAGAAAPEGGGAIGTSGTPTAALPKILVSGETVGNAAAPTTAAAANSSATVAPPSASATTVAPAPNLFARAAGGSSTTTVPHAKFTTSPRVGQSSARHADPDAPLGPGGTSPPTLSTTRPDAADSAQARRFLSGVESVSNNNNNINNNSSYNPAIPSSSVSASTVTPSVVGAGAVSPAAAAAASPLAPSDDYLPHLHADAGGDELVLNENSSFVSIHKSMGLGGPHGGGGASTIPSAASSQTTQRPSRSANNGSRSQPQPPSQQQQQQQQPNRQAPGGLNNNSNNSGNYYDGQSFPPSPLHPDTGNGNGGFSRSREGSNTGLRRISSVGHLSSGRVTPGSRGPSPPLGAVDAFTPGGRSTGGGSRGTPLLHQQQQAYGTGIRATAGSVHSLHSLRNGTAGGAAQSVSADGRRSRNENGMFVSAEGRRSRNEGGVPDGRRSRNESVAYSTSTGGVRGGATAAATGAPQPQWMNAVERLKRDDAGFGRPAAATANSTAGSGLTAGKLRALEASYQAGRRTPVSTAAAPRYGAGAGGTTPLLVAQEEAGSNTTMPHSYSYRGGGNGAGGPANGAGTRGSVGAATSEQSARRTHIRASSAALSGSGRSNATSGTVLVAAETNQLSPNAGGSIVSPTSAGGGLHGFENRIANFVRTGSVPNLFGGSNTNSNGGRNGTFTSANSGGAGGGAAPSVASGGQRKSLTATPPLQRLVATEEVAPETPPPRQAYRPRADVEEDRRGRRAAKHMEDDDRDETGYRTRNINALHAIPWDQRRQMPMSGFGTKIFAIFSSPRFWEKMDWTFRAAVLTVLPTMILSLEPTTKDHFPLPSYLAFNAFWITAPTFGSGLHETVIAIKGFAMGVVCSIIMIAIAPGPPWLSILLMFIIIVVAAFIAEETKKTAGYVMAANMMAYIADKKGTNYAFTGDYMLILLIALGFGLVGFLLPFIRWSSGIARHYVAAMGNSLSISVQGMCSSFWVRNPLERELNVVRLTQLRQTAGQCMRRIEVALDETEYEPHLGSYVDAIKVRYAFCKRIYDIEGSMMQVVELAANDPSILDTPLCRDFGAAIGDDLSVISSAMDSMILKIVDFHRMVTPEEVLFFQQARARFQDAVSRVREEVILTNEDYNTDHSDIYLGFFLFSVDEICEVIADFHEEKNPRNIVKYFLSFPLRDVKSTLNAFQSLFYTVIYGRTITRRLKEAIKLSLCMAIASIFQVYALDGDATSPMAGAAVIAFMYSSVGSDSFHYASGRLLGTVLGSLLSLLSVQIANGRLWALYLCILALSLIGCYVQSAPGFYALGNAIVCSTISITTQYQDQSAAMIRIQQNCFAILMYFAITSLLWPVRARDKIKMSLDTTLRCLRETTACMLRNLDMPEDANEVAADCSALLTEMSRKIATQARFIPGAVEEPTMTSAEYPEEQWRAIVAAERKIHSTLAMMRYAYFQFMSSSADDDTALSVHWVVLHRIAPHAQDLSDLLYALIDLYLLSLGKATVVPTTHLTKLRCGMIDASTMIINTYIETICRKVTGEDEEDNDRCAYDEDDDFDDDGLDGSFPSSAPAPGPASPSSPKREGDGNDDNNNNTSVGGNMSISKRPGSATAAPASPTTTKKDDNNNASNTNNNASGTEGPKKKKGYLGYEMTEEEKEALRNFVAGRGVANNNSFNGTMSRSLANSMQRSISLSAPPTNGTFAGSRNGPAASLVGGNTNASFQFGAFGSGAAMRAADGFHDDKLLAVSGADTGLAARLRRKHKIKVPNKDDDKSDDSSSTSSGALAATRKGHRSGNASLNNTRSGKSREEGGDNTNTNNQDDNDGFVDLDHLRNNNNSFIKNNSFLRNTSFLGKMFSRASRRGTAADDVSLGASLGASMGASMAGSPPRANASPMSTSPPGPNNNNKPPLGKPPRAAPATGKTVAGANAKPAAAEDEEGEDDTHSDSGPQGSGNTEKKVVSGTSTAREEDDDDLKKATSSSTSPDADKQASRGGANNSNNNNGSSNNNDADNNTATAAGAGTGAGNRLPGESSSPVKDDKAAEKFGSTPERHSHDKDEELFSRLDSSASSASSNTSAHLKMSQLRGSKNVTIKLDNIVLRNGPQDGTNNGGSEADGAGRGGSGGMLGGTVGSADTGEERLRNISFFDEEKGEFILTNHDVHSLEAFLFGVKALVVFVNDLQRAILEMQHASDLARNL